MDGIGNEDEKTDGNDVEDDDDRIPNDEEVCDNLFKELREKNIDASNENQNEPVRKKNTAVVEENA